jgi:predicted secreted protein
MKAALLSFLLLFSVKVQAKTMIRVKALGASPKGQFVAFEEFGYINNTDIPFARIKVMNVWKKKYVGKSINVVSGQKEKLQLDQVRAKAKKLAIERLKEFNIST